MAQERKPELVGGGLIRSLGGWSQVLSLRRRGEKTASDERILGSSEFVQSLLDDLNEREKETLRLRANLKDLASLATEIGKEGGISLQAKICDTLYQRNKDLCTRRQK